MAELINLRSIRKRKARAEEEAAAESNRRRFGRSKSERARQEAEQALQAHRLDEHKRED
jgi:hypothetical protein